jgi:hypothetical protein
MITINLKGSIGNQLFQLCTLISHSIQYSKSFIIPYSDELYEGDTIYKTYWDTFLSNIKPYTSGNGKFPHVKYINHLLVMKHPVYNETSFNYNKIDESVENVCLNGSFQSYKYFNDNKDKLMLILNVEHQRILIRGEHFDYLNIPNVASMHFKIADCKDGHNDHEILDEDYYDKTLSLLPDDYRVLVFSKKQDRLDVEHIIDRLKMKHNNEFVYVADEIEDWKQMLIMSLCRVNIISNSVFSWWGAYLNKDADKIYCPSIWFGNDSEKNAIDLLLPEWEIVKI